MFRVLEGGVRVEPGLEGRLAGAISDLERERRRGGPEPGEVDVGEVASWVSSETYRAHPLAALRQRLPGRFHRLLEPGVEAILGFRSVGERLEGDGWVRPAVRQAWYLGAELEGGRVVLVDAAEGPGPAEGGWRKLAAVLAEATGARLRALEASDRLQLDWLSLSSQLKSLLAGIALALVFCGRGDLLLLSTPFLLAARSAGIRAGSSGPRPCSDEQRLRGLALVVNMLALAGLVPLLLSLAVLAATAFLPLLSFPEIEPAAVSGDEVIYLATFTGVIVVPPAILAGCVRRLRRQVLWSLHSGGDEGAEN